MNRPPRAMTCVISLLVSLPPSAGCSSGSKNAAAGAVSASVAAPASAVAREPMPLEAKGTLGGRPFVPRSAYIFAGHAPGQVPMWRAAVLETADANCSRISNGKKGEHLVQLTVPWKEGATLPVSIEKSTLDSTSFYAVDGSGSLESVDGAPQITGAVTSLKAPSGKGSVGKVRFDLKAGDYTLKGDLDVIQCF